MPLREYPASLEGFKKVINRYPKSRKVPDAYYKRGLTYLRIKDPRRAALEFEKLIENHPKHRLFEKTQKKLRALYRAGVEKTDNPSFFIINCNWGTYRRSFTARYPPQSR